jgi:hypothetical protein
MLSALFAGCAGQTQNTVPVTPAASQSAGERTIATFMIDRSTAAAVAAKVTSAGAYKLPLRGEALAPAPAGASRITMRTGAYTLSYYGGPTVSSATIYNILVNNTGSYWGNPGTFFTNWNTGGSTTFEHLLDQYVNTTALNRYPYGGDIEVSYNTSSQLSDQDMYNIIHPVAAQYGTGYNHIYHVYFMQGVQECSTVAGGCYAVSGGYCGYHSSVNFSDIGHTLYSFEGYQNIAGCNAPDNLVADSTDSTVSHETYEIITDPDINNGTLAWYNSRHGEIGDECRSNYSNVTLNGTSYNIQEEWSNHYNACSYSP